MRHEVVAGKEIDRSKVPPNMAISFLRGSAQARGYSQELPRASVLDDFVRDAEITADLRTQKGNLSAKTIADAYGLSMSELAVMLHRTKQAVSQTPDAESLQAVLGFFERIARLRVVLRDSESFRKWLRTPNRRLGGEAPLGWITRGRLQALADLVEDILTGAPS